MKTIVLASGNPVKAEATAGGFRRVFRISSSTSCHEFGDADDVVFGRTNSKQREGAVGLLTGGVVDRRRLYEQSVVLALVAFRNRALYRREERTSSTEPRGPSRSR